MDELPDSDLIRRLPLSLATSLERALRMDAGPPVAFAWCVRDALEAVARTFAVVLVSEYFALPMGGGVRTVEADGELASSLLKGTGLSFGDWAQIAERAHGWIAPNGRMAPDTFLRLDRVPGGLRDLLVRLRGTVAWRNAIFGHGVFRESPAFYGEEARRHLPLLVDAAVASDAVLDGAQLLAVTRDGRLLRFTGQRGSDLAALDDAPPLRADLVRGAERLPLWPLVLGRLRAPDSVHDYVLDRFLRGEADGAEEIRWLQLLTGDPWRLPARDAAGPLLAILDERVRARGRKTFDLREAQADDERWQSFFRDRRHSPARLRARVVSAIESPACQTGYLHVRAEGGVGKTFLMEDLAATPPEGWAVLVLRVPRRPEHADPRVLAIRLGQLARTLPFQTNEPQVLGQSPDAIRHEIASWLGCLRVENGLGRLVLVLDGLDEIEAGASSSEAEMLAFLPDPGDLARRAPGCVVVFSSRPELRPSLQREIDRCHAARVDILRDGPEYIETLRDYLRAQSGAPPRLHDAILAAADHRWIWVDHLARALSCGVLDDAIDLPRGDAFYPAYLDRLCGRVGDEVYQVTHRRLLAILVAVTDPIDREALEDLGFRPDHAAPALWDLAGFLEARARAGGGRAYRAAHALFRTWVATEPTWAPALEQAHAALARAALTIASAETLRAASPSSLAWVASVGLPEHLACGGELARGLASRISMWSAIVDDHLAGRTPSERASLAAIELRDAQVGALLWATAQFGDDALRARLAHARVARGRVSFDTGLLDRALEDIDAALLELGSAPGEDANLRALEARAVRSNTLYWIGRPDEALAEDVAICDDYARIAAATAREDVRLAHLDARLEMSYSLLECARDEDAMAAIEAVITDYDGLAGDEAEHGGALARLARAEFLVLSGRLRDAVEEERRGVAVLRALCDSDRLPDREFRLVDELCDLARWAERIGDTEYASAVERELRDRLSRLEEGGSAPRVAWARMRARTCSAERLLARGMAKASERAATRAVDDGEAMQREGRRDVEGPLADALRVRARAREALGHRELAREDAARAALAAGRARLRRYAG